VVSVVTFGDVVSVVARIRVRSGTGVPEAVAALRAAYDTLAACDLDALTVPELLALDDLEALSCQLPTQLHRVLARLQVDTTPHQLGAKSWRNVLTTTKASI
jgi:hypothetical protein